ncbi:Hypothetical predicted protein, partial [Olea europaea subsp. europaea]
ALIKLEPPWDIALPIDFLTINPSSIMITRRKKTTMNASNTPGSSEGTSQGVSSIPIGVEVMEVDASGSQSIPMPEPIDSIEWEGKNQGVDPPSVSHMDCDVVEAASEGVSGKELSTTMEDHEASAQPIDESMSVEEVRFNNSKDIVGFADNSKNCNTARICFVPSIPYNCTEFWLTHGQGKATDPNDELYIWDGELKLSIAVLNLTGPRISVDMYCLYDYDLTHTCPMLDKTTVKKDFEPRHSSIGVKFNIDQRLSRAVITPGDIYTMTGRQMREQVDIASFTARKTIPCYLLVFHGLDPFSHLEITFSNRILYSIKHAIELPKEILTQASTWEDWSEDEL